VVLTKKPSWPLGIKAEMRGKQISSEVADGERSLILKQVENGVWLRMALLHLYLKDQK
jgi:aspartate carbamoyltransferase catalytic subunit